MEADASRHALLEAIPIGGIEHSGRPLAKHLIGTHDLLAKWGSAEHVCLAGLLHSVYGTKTFPVAALTPAAREDVRRLIGERAEALVYAFGLSDRKRLLLESRSKSPRWIDFRTGEETAISSAVLTELVTLEAANFLEQLPFLGGAADRVLRDMRHRFETASPWIPDAAAEALRQASLLRPVAGEQAGE